VENWRRLNLRLQGIFEPGQRHEIKGAQAAVLIIAVATVVAKCLPESGYFIFSLPSRRNLQQIVPRGSFA
jgi:hypothetical protein